MSVGIRMGKKGFTVVEVLVALAIFSVSLLGLAAGAATIMRANQQSYFSTVATNLAQDKLEELKSRAPTITSHGPIPETVNGVVFNRRWEVTPNSPALGIQRVVVTVEWTDYAFHTLTVSSMVQG